MQKTKRTAETNVLRAEIDNLTIRAESRSVNLTWTTGYKGLRSSYDGPFYEELSLDPSAVDLTHLAAGAPLLKSHDATNLDSVVGVVERVWLKDNQGKATVRFSDDLESEKLFQKVKSGIIRSVSVGYSVEQYTDVSKEGDEIPTLRATRWTPRELSAVSIPFDPGAQFYRNQENNKSKPDFNFEVPIIQEKIEMNIKDNAERTRQSEIRLAVRAAKLEEIFADQLCDSDVTADDARKQIIAKLADVKAATSVENTVRVEVGDSSQDKKRAGLVDAIAHRLDNTYKPNADARLFLNRTFPSMVEQYLGRKLSEASGPMITRAMSTSDVPLILAASAEKSIANIYNAQPRSFESWVKKDVLRNYKTHSRVASSQFSDLAEKAENGEFTYSFISEEGESVSIKRYGRILGLTKEAMVNDDLGALGQVIAEAGAAAARLENRLVYSKLAANGVMSDSVALFHGTHSNLGTAGAISETTLEELSKSMMKQKSVGGVENLNLIPRFLICGPDNLVSAKKMLAQISPTQSSSSNPFSGAYEIVCDAEISNKNWYLAADPASVDTVTLYRLQGEETPRVYMKANDFNTGDFALKIEHSCGAGITNYRGLAKNPFV